MKTNKTRRTKRTARDTAEFDREFVADSFKSPSPKARAKWAKAKRKRGRPKEGKGAKVISVSVEQGLLDLVDELAHKMRISRARLIARGLRAVLASQGIETP